MNTIAIKPEHFEITLGWLRAREAYIPSFEEMPAIGYIAYETELPIAAGYLRFMEGNCGMIDGLCTDPIMPPQLRNRAINCVVDQILMTAKHLKLKKIIAFTLDEKVVMRAIRYGFEKLPHQLIVLDMNSCLLEND